MKTGMRLWWTILCAVLCTSAGQTSWAQKAPVPSRVVEQIDETRTVQIQGNVHPLARAEFDRGGVAESQPMTRMLLLLERSTEQETALRQLIDAQQTKGSGNYHSWLTPAQFGQQFGPSDSDIQAVTDWLTKQGFQVAKVAAGRTLIEFSGNVGQVQNAFHTQIHHFEVNGKERIANISDPVIPQALSPVIAGIVALHNFPKRAQLRNNGIYRRVKATGELKPLFTYGSPANYALGPADFSTIYNIPSTATGAGQSIAVLELTNINIQDVRDFRTMFGLPANDPVIVLNGPDPGIANLADEGEADLDVEWAGAVAPQAKIYMVASQSTESNPAIVSFGGDLSALYAVDNNLAPVISYSYGSCEASNGTAGNQFYNTLWEQAAAQGITVAVAAGDTGSAGCDDSSAETAATQGVAVGGTSSTPFNVSVGGTDFIPTSVTTAPNQYWGSTNNATTAASALKYIPETPWNDSTCATQYPTVCTPAAGGDDLSAGGGGPSNCVVSTTNSSGNVTCTTNSTFPHGGYPMPSWQIGVVPSTYNTRTQPDVSFFASNGGNLVAYVICQSDANTGSGSSTSSCNLNSPYLDFQLVGGTSAATPAFAAVMALVNQATGQRQGNANYVLYGLAANDANYKGGSCNSATPPLAACVFNDVVQSSNSSGVEWNNSVACMGGSPNCSQSSSSLFGILVLNNIPAFVAGPQYDLATGLGSINVGSLLSKWSSVSRTATTTTLSNLNPTTPTSGSNFTATVTVTSTAGTPTGDVSLNALASDGVTIAGSFGPFTLSGGTVNAVTTLLPPGAASISAYYGGDATHAGSLSSVLPLGAPVAGAGKSSKTVLGFVTLDSSGNATVPITSSQNFVYGSTGYFLNIAVQDGSGNSCTFNYPKTTPTGSVPCPTGKITLTDNGNPLNDFPNGTQNFVTNVATLNNNGVAQDQPINVNVGAHSIVATYAGDGNYSGSTSNTLSLTLTQATTKTAVASSLGTITSGASVTLSALVTTPSGANGPTGNVTFTNGATSLGMGTCTSTSGMSNPNGSNGTTPATAFCIATLTTTISALYPVPQSRPRPPVVPIVLLATSIVAYLALLRWMPENRKRAYAYVALLVFAMMAIGIAGCGGGGGGGSSTPTSKTVTINAAYAGDTNYAPSSGMTSIVVQ